MNDSARPHSPAAERNRGPILIELQRLLPAQGTMLEIAAGTGQHAAHFASALPLWRWQASDGDAESLPSIAARCEGLANALPPIQLDVMAPQWPAAAACVDAVFCANMIHISPWATTAALMAGAGRHLTDTGLLLLYGPFVVDGEPTAPSNLAFDASLRERNPQWGLRRLADVAQQAALAGLALLERVPMPANNLLIVFARGG